MDSKSQFKYIEYIEKFINKNYTKEEFIEIFEYFKKSYSNGQIYSQINHYIELFPENREKIQKLQYYFEKNNNDDLLILLDKAINKSSYKSRYLEWFQQLLSYEDEESAIIQLHRFQIPEKRYERYLTLFENRFPNSQKEVAYLRNLYDKYQKYFNLKKESINVDKDIDRYLNFIIDIIESNYSLEEYLHMYGGYSIKEIINIVDIKIKKSYPILYEKFEEVLERDKKNFYDNIKLIIKRINEKEDFDVFDYYYLTRLKPNDFLSISKKIMPNINLSKIKILINKISKMSNLIINKQVEINGLTIINGREVTTEEKEKIFSFLEENNMPMFAYKFALRKYVNNDTLLTEYINQKRKNY